MAKVKPTKDGLGEQYVSFKCPGCSDQHVIPVTGSKAWGFNGSMERPTLTPSILCRYSGVAEGTDAPVNDVCHSFVTDGRIQFLSDSTHALAGQTVDLPEIAES